MSVFQVDLHNGNIYSPVDPGCYGQGLPAGSNTPRTIYCPGPNKTNRILEDGAIFTDCNYWKQFAYPNLPLNEAFINVISDDGSIYEAGQVTSAPIVYNLTVGTGTTYTTFTSRSGNNIVGNYAPILSDNNGSAANFIQITNTQASGYISVRVNGNNNAIFQLQHGATQTFNPGDMSVTLLEFDNSVSGYPTASVQIIGSVVSQCNS